MGRDINGYEYHSDMSSRYTPNSPIRAPRPLLCEKEPGLIDGLNNGG